MVMYMKVWFYLLLLFVFMIAVLMCVLMLLLRVVALFGIEWRVMFEYLFGKIQ